MSSSDFDFHGDWTELEDTIGYATPPEIEEWFETNTDYCLDWYCQEEYDNLKQQLAEGTITEEEFDVEVNKIEEIEASEIPKEKIEEYYYRWHENASYGDETGDPEFDPDQER